MMKTLTTLILFLFSFTVLKARQTDEVQMQKVLSQLKISKQDIHEALYREKVLPNDPSKTVVVIPKYRVRETDRYGNLFLQLDAYVILADTKSGTILSRYVEDNAWTSDADVLQDITIDTGLYKLAPSIRAFGIRADYEGSSGPNPNHKTELSLFTVQNKTIKKLLDNYPVISSVGEWDTSCAGEFEETKAAISIGQNKTNGLANLQIKSTITYRKNYLSNGECKSRTSTKQTVSYLKYNGREYK